MERKRHGAEKQGAANIENVEAAAGEESKEHVGGEGFHAVPDTGSPGEEPCSEIKQLEEALLQKEAESSANWDKYLRERADLENYRKRVQREKEDLLKYGNESLLLEILPAVDSMEMALSHATEESGSAVIEGVTLTLTMLLSTLKKFGATPMESKGKVFDPAFHQAMTQVESSGSAPNTVIDEYQKGYMLNDRLLRAALVSVAMAPKKVDL